MQARWIGLGCSTLGMDIWVCFCVKVGFGSFGSNGGDMVRGRDESSCVMVTCCVCMRL